MEEFLILSIFSVPLIGTDYIKLMSKISKKIYICSNGTIPEGSMKYLLFNSVAGFMIKKLLYLSGCQDRIVNLTKEPLR